MAESSVRPGSGPGNSPISPARPEMHRLSRDLTARLARSGIACAGAPNAPAGADLTAVVRGCLGWLVQRLELGRAPDGRIERLEPAAAEWARDGVPIDTVLRGVHHGVRAGLDALFPDPASGFDITTGTTAVVELLDLISCTVSKAYIRELRGAADGHQTSVHTLTSALLGGHGGSAMARESGIAPAPGYFVLALAVPAHSDEHRPDLDRAVVARRKLRRLQSALAGRFGEHALSLLSVDGGTVLVPEDRCTEAEIDDLVRELAAAALVPLTATVFSAPPESVATAARQAHELLDTVEQLGLQPGVHRFDELALEYQLTRPGIGRDLLRTQLAPLTEHPELLHTLRVYIAADRHRQLAAQRLYVHPNTLDYRLRRVGELTGLNPTEPRDWWYLHAAVVATARADP
ncbi:PucR family transcriptional regulator [Nocardia harenae]|uniref:PucR family transcriptional regulator n=1 Tax=Nocardia harenae TaxID=358707 RepID=UPI00082A3BB3|nr:helix-turn-helix domain-containing protein [Nocardia harenae]